MEEPERFIREHFEKRFTLKEKLIGSPEQSLGKKFSQVTLENCVKYWSFSSSQCTQADVKNMEYCPSRDDLVPLPKDELPYPRNFRPEEEAAPEVTPLKAPYFQHSIVVLQ